MTKAKLFNNYLNYEYRIKWFDDSVHIINDDISELFNREIFDNCSIISASNPRSKILSDETNKFRNNKLKHLLHAFDYKFLFTEKISVDPATLEPDGRERIEAFFIFDILENYAKRIANKFGQSSLVYISYDPSIYIYLFGLGTFRGQKRLIYRQSD